MAVMSRRSKRILQTATVKTGESDTLPQAQRIIAVHIKGMEQADRQRPTVKACTSLHVSLKHIFARRESRGATQKVIRHWNGVDACVCGSFE